MIQLTKPIRRLTRSTDRKGIPLVVSLEPGDMLCFRSKGKRRTVSVFLGHAYNLACIMQAEQDYKHALILYKSDKQAGYRRHKPKRPQLPMSPIYFKALKS